MKHTIRLVILAAIMALTLPGLSQAQPGNGSVGECTEDNKGKFYTLYYVNRKGKTTEHPNGDQNIAYDAAKKYLAACPNADDSDQYAKVLKKFVADYEFATRRDDFLAAYDKKNVQETLRLGKLVLADDPNYIRAYLLMGDLGYVVFPTVVPEFVEYAKKAIELLEAGKTPDDWRSFGVKTNDAAAGKLTTLARLNFALGLANFTKAPSDAVPYLLKAARLETPIKKDSITYHYLAYAYDLGPSAKLTEDYIRLYKDKPATPESKLAQANIDQFIDRTIDAFARAVALAPSADPTIQEKKKGWLERLTELYKYRHKSDAGLNQLIAGVLSKPVPDVPMPLTTLPTPPATEAAALGIPTPSGTSAPQPAKPGVVSNTPVQPVNKTPTSPKTTTPTTGKATKTKPKSNHRRRP